MNSSQLRKLWFYIKRGEFLYLLSKGVEKIKKNRDIAKDAIKIEPKDYFIDFNKDIYRLDVDIDIIIPVYNGYEFLNPLFDSLDKNTSPNHRLIVIDDCSPDERVKPLLAERLKNYKNSIFLEHQINLGFVKSVNEGYSYATNHFVILNTDTEVPPFWLERLMYPILNVEKIASTTPFTNSGEIASFPNFLEDNEIFLGMGVDEVDSAFKDVAPSKLYGYAPTGVGFCMGVNYNLTQDIGLFIEKDFGKGYGEENEWCQRAIKKGFSNLIIPNLFVYHKHGGSFTAEQKRILIKENSIKLLHKHPNYGKDVERYIKKNPHQYIRELLIMVSTPLDLIINQSLGGGSNLYSNNHIEEYKKENRAVLELVFNYYSNGFYLFFNYKDYSFKFELDSLDEVEELLVRVKIEEIFVNNLVSYQNIYSVIEFISRLNKRASKLVVVVHDYLFICPNYTLLNIENRFCNIPKNLNECSRCLKNSNLEWRSFFDEDIDIREWRDKFGGLLNLSSKILCFSNSSKDIILKSYSSLDISKIEVTPHKVEPLERVNYIKQDKSYTTIGVLGAINEAKGASIIEELLEIADIDNLPIKVTLIGDTSKPISSPRLKITGRYRREELTKIVEREKIDIFLIPSICPETFSYTTQEIIMMDMPLMVFNVGALPERVREYNKGVVLEQIDIQSILDYVLENR